MKIYIHEMVKYTEVNKGIQCSKFRLVKHNQSRKKSFKNEN